AEIATPKSGLYLAPTRRQESLLSNLLTVESYPPNIFIADTECRRAYEVREALRKTKQEADGIWVLWEKKIVTFHDLNMMPWASVCDAGTCERFETKEWADSTDPTRQRIFVQLLNQALRDQINSRVRYWPQEDCYAIAGRPRRLSYQ